ncbi:Mandelamide amidase, variant 2 [Balamuthia mandrillaris]
MTEPRTALSATEAALKNAKALSHLNAFISIDESVSLQQAQAIDSLPQEEKAKKPLLGLPIAIKDNINTAAFATSGGTPTLKDWRPKQDAPIVQQLLDAGTVIVGKANMHELALGITSNNATFGPARNPYDPTRVAGGSSGGTAVAVSARIVPVGIGTDTGGSGRIPAAMCGCIGFRPTLGRYRCDGVLPLSSTRDTPTLMALTMDHILLLDSVLSSSSSSCSSSSSSASSLRIGLPKNYYWDGIDEEVKQVIEQAIQKIDSALTQKAKDAKTESSGVIPVELVEEGQQMDQLNKATYPIIFYEMGRETAAYLYLHGCDKVSSVRELWEGMAAPDEKGLLMAQLDPITATTAEQYRFSVLCFFSLISCSRLLLIHN